ncbi:MULTISPECIES: TetR/AcrR family transcriptional regulator [unclassified Pseudoalteromonas]|uniref:TetR/AcrR family transcriptional regulator n=1 Tax=unclassified Pseudoalteromonas TaxID=194690 RepID=UPI0030154CF3
MTQLSQKQQSILCAAIEEFAQKGLQATTMESISQSAEVSKRTLYKHYSTKDELFDAVVELLIERIKPITAIQFIPNYDFSVQLEHLAKSAMTLLNDEDYMRLSRIVMIESMRSYERAQNLNEKFGHCEAAMIQWFDDAARAGCLGHYDADFAASYFWGALKKLGYWERAIKWQAPMPEAELDLVVKKAVALFCNGVTPLQ